MKYKLYEGSTLKTTVSSKTATITGLTPLTTYTFGVTPNNGLRDGTQKTISVKTRGVRLTIPTTLTAGATISLRYQEYSLGLVPIGTEPSGMFGGGNKQNLSAKVISTENGSSVVEVAGTGTISHLKLEPGTIATPYASFVDGDTFTTQPDGTCALFSEYKALYY